MVTQLKDAQVDRLMTILERLERELQPSKLAFSDRKTEIMVVRMTLGMAEAVRALAKAHELSINALLESIIWKACGSRDELIE